MAKMIDISFARVVRPLVLATTLAVLAGCGQTGEPSTTVPTESSLTPPASSPTAEPGDGAIHGTFDVGGHELFMDCAGTGAPTVVMLHGIIWESGFGGDSIAWDATRKALTTRTCAYDRRNVGLSEQVPGTSTAIDAVEDLHGLLRAAAVDPPYVLAGHSFGGLLSLLYAGTYPDEVAGIVLVDATLPLEWELDPQETIPATIIELNDNAERIDFYGAGATTDAVLDNLPQVPITYLYALQQEGDPDWEEGAYFAALRRFVRSLPEGRLVKFDTDHDMLHNIPEDVAEQIRKILGVLDV
jgi:pimeloyl-ACP methyl ester carboxylesterase/predicted small lipoprotein YifL